VACTKEGWRLFLMIINSLIVGLIVLGSVESEKIEVDGQIID
jgi:hypothetical protein